MSQKDPLSSQHLSASNASDKRTAWKNSLTVIASERDSLLTNSGEDRLSSFDSRHDQRLQRDSSPNDLQFDKENNNRLKVPSPARRSGFYSTSPSTDEGIGADENVTDEFLGKSGTDKNSNFTEREKNNKEFNNKQQSLKQSSVESTTKSQFDSATSRKNSSAFATKLPESLMISRHNASYLARNQSETHCSEAKRANENHYYDFPTGYPDHVPYDQQAIYHNVINPCHFVVNENGNYVPLLYSDDAHHLWPQPFSRTITQNNEKFRTYSPQMSNAKRNRQIWRQASERRPNTALRSRNSCRRNSWTSVASCCELGRGEHQSDDGPVLVYSRMPEEVRSCESRLPALFERHETEVVTTKNGIPMSRIVSKSVEERSDQSKKTQETREVAKSTSELTTHQRQTTPTNDNIPTLEAEKSSYISTKSRSNCSLSTSSSKSEPQRKQKLSSPSSKSFKEPATNPASRTGSLRSSALADAVMSSSIVATATGSAVTENALTPKEKQRSLTDRLMTVGPSDPRRVQGIVQDILCEMGEKRIIQYKDAFAKFDKDSSGIISSKQLRTLLRSLGHNPSDTELRELINQVDMDENGKIDFNEFIIMIGYFDKANNENEDLINIFRVYDREGKGCIDVNELKNVWNNYLKDSIPDESFEEMVRIVDEDGNGEINRMELLELLSTR